MKTSSKALLALSLLPMFAAFGARAEEPNNNRLMVVDSGRVIYDDGRNDLYCVARHRFIGYTYDGEAVYRRRMRCR